MGKADLCMLLLTGKFAGLMLGAHSQDWEIYESQSKQFQNFLIRANKYPSLQLNLGEGITTDTSWHGLQNKVVLVEVSVGVLVDVVQKIYDLLL